MKKYIEKVKEATDLKINVIDMIPNNYIFSGFTYENIKEYYESFNLETIFDARKKAMFLRIALEACLFQLTTKQKFNPERIGSEYKKVINASSGEKKGVAVKLKELYDLTKKFHHGADEGSTLGLAWINPDEMEFLDKELTDIFIWIDHNCVIKSVI